MSKESLMDAISHLDLDLIENYFKEKEANGKIKKTYWNWKKYSAVAAIFCVLVSSMFVMFSIMKKPTQTKEFSLPVGEEYIAWLSDDASVYDENASKMKWNGLNVSENLYSTLQDVEDETYIAIIVRNDDDSLLSQFEFQGKKYEDYQRKYDELIVLSDKLEAITKEGEYLKYGDTLYIDGAPDGTKWTKEYYNERLIFYGDELIDKYISNGEFHSADVAEDIIIIETDISTQLCLMEEAIEAYGTYNVERMYQIFEESNYCVTSKNDNLYLIISKDDFSKLSIENAGSYDFYSASLSGYKGTISLDSSVDDVPSITDNVTGFEISKIHFDIIDDENFVISNDQDVIEALNHSISTWKNSYDSLEFTFYFYMEETVNEDWFEEMNYVEIWQLNYPTRIVVEVAYENINVEALKELSQRNEISSIHITNPSGFESDVEPAVP